MAESIQDFVLTRHAADQMQRRGLDPRIVRRVLAVPEQRWRVRPGRDVLQAVLELEDKSYLVRVFVDVSREPAAVITGYRTSKIEKYRRREP